MTDITPLVPAFAQVIGGYGAGFVKISGRVYTRSVLVTPERVLPWTGEHDSLLDIPDLDILLLGTGPCLVPVSSELRARFRAREICLDVMNTPAACRTYNVLMPEGRRVAAALWIEEGVGMPS